MYEPEAQRFVLAVSSNKGGVGKTTLSANLAIYLRALREELPILVVGLDDQGTLDRMFAIHPREPGAKNLKHGWAERSLAGVIQLGEYGIHFVPSPPDVALLKARAEDPLALRGILERTAWPGIVILDTKSDLEALTLNAFHAADRILVPVSDWASLEEAGKTFQALERSRLDPERARVVLTLVDRRTRGGEQGEPLALLLQDEIERRGWPLYATALSRSPRVEALNSAGGKPLSILHHARGTAVHAELRELAEEILEDLGLGERLAPPERGRPAPPRRGARPGAAGAGEGPDAEEEERPARRSWAAELLGGVLRRL
jgi:cellulose biosynthesis protein BcsQ